MNNPRLTRLWKLTAAVWALDFLAALWWRRGG